MCLSLAVETPRGFLAAEEIARSSERIATASGSRTRPVTASVNLDGKMVDVPVYKRAQVIMARARAVADTERRKTEALRRNARRD